MGYARLKDVKEKRQATICYFKDGITYEEFIAIASRIKKQIKRIKKVNVIAAVIYCTVESQTGYSDWDFHIDFNDWGHITGTYWTYTENHDSNIPKHYGSMVSREISVLLHKRKIHLLDYSDIVDANGEIGTPSGLSFRQSIGLFERIFSSNNAIISKFDSEDLREEHLYFVVSALKSNGFKRIKSIPIKDVGRNSDKFVYEVEQIVINGISFFEEGDRFPITSEVIVTYHMKKEIAIPYHVKHFRRRNYIYVGDQLQDLGFSNIYERKITDLIIGFMTKDGSVEDVFVDTGNGEELMNKGELYEYDTKIVITYHTFK